MVTKRGKPRKVKEVMQELGNQVSPDTKAKQAENHNPRGAGRKTGINERRLKVDELHHKGYRNHEIAEALGISLKQVSIDLKVIKRLLEPKLIRTLEFRRNQARKRLDFLRKKSWEMADNSEAKSGARVAALRLVKEIEELSAKIEGFIADKTPSGPEKKAEELSRRLVEIARGKDGDGRKDIEVSEVASAD